MEKIESFIIYEKSSSMPFYVELAGVTFPSPNYEITRSHSPCFVLEYVVGGTGTVEIDGETFSPTAGDVYLLPYGSKHHYFASKTDPYEKIWMNVCGPLCQNLIEIYSLSGKYHFPNVPARQLFDRMLSVCRDKALLPYEVHTKCALIFHEILSLLAFTDKANKSDDSHAARAKLFCDRNIYGKITAEDVSEKIGLSISQLNRLFKREYGVTVYSYILDTKIRTAKSLLSSSSMQVNKIAMLLAFTDEHYFTKIFKAKAGMTPSEWRAAQKK